MKLGFSILHYQLSEVTIDCVNSILKNIKDVEIVVVDNGSPNGSGKYLNTFFDDYDRVTCISLDSNLGFAKGNNVGYFYLKNIGCDYICCVNNDTLIEQYNFKQILEEEYRKTNFSVLAPRVYLKDRTLQSFNPSLGSVEDYEKELALWKSSFSMKDYFSEKDLLTKLLQYFPTTGSKLRKLKQMFSKNLQNSLENVVLHGCFLVFSPQFVTTFDSAFDNRTFMYREEELLYIKVRLNNLKTLYCPKLSIIHLEDLATNSIVKTQAEKFQFIKENQILSLEILIDTMKEIDKRE